MSNTITPNNGVLTILDFPGATLYAGLRFEQSASGGRAYTDAAGNTHGFVFAVSTQTFQSIDDPDGVGTTIVNGINDRGFLTGKCVPPLLVQTVDYRCKNECFRGVALA